MGQALYRKYRSKSLDEVVGQQHITQALQNALSVGRVSHAYLFTGPRGVGKTSVARILAHALNELAYDEQSNHIDIIEIDAASNRRIDEIRELRDRVQNAPAQSKYKVYIIDEVHMLTREAFNALLKTLEEPPAHAVFILATTELHKVPETIISRTQRFNFKPIDAAAVVEHLRFIAKAEGIQATDDALRMIAEHGGGSFRDSISLLDQAGSQGSTVDAEAVMRLLGIAPAEVITSLVGVVMTGDLSTAVKLLEMIRTEGFQPVTLSKQLSASLRELLMKNPESGHSQLLSALNKLLTVPASADPDLSFEIAILETVVERNSAQPGSKPVKTSSVLSQPPNIVVTAVRPDGTDKIPAEKKPTESSPIAIVNQPAKVLTSLDDAAWKDVLTAVKKRHNTLYGLVRMAEPTLDEDILTLCFKFSFHQKRINEARNKQMLIETISAAFGRPIAVECSLDPIAAANTKKRAKTEPDDITTISNIFGAAEVLES